VACNYGMSLRQRGTRLGKKLRLNANVLKGKESATLAINQEVKRRRNQGKAVYHFGFGQSPFPVCDVIVQDLIKHAHEKDYLPSFGLPALQSSIEKYLKREFDYNFDPNFIAIGPGSKELIFQALLILEGPILVPAPSWVSYGPQAEILGKRMVPILTNSSNGYRITPELLKSECKKLNCDQKILILNNPSNPTGQVYQKNEIEEIAALCREENIIIISDEIYANICFDSIEYYGPARSYPEGTLVTGGLSKSFSAGGYRIGYLAIPQNLQSLADAFKITISETFSCVSSPIQYAAVNAFSENKEVISYVNQCTKIHEIAGLYLYDRFKKMKLNCSKPQGAFYLFPDFEHYREKLSKNGIDSSAKLCEHLLEKVDVAFLPGEDFYLPSSSLSVRVASVDYDGGQVFE